MSALDPLQFNETAVEYLDEAYRIRLAELGSSHPHTVPSRSQLRLARLEPPSAAPSIAAYSASEDSRWNESHAEQRERQRHGRHRSAEAATFPQSSESEIREAEGAAPRRRSGLEAR